MADTLEQIAERLVDDYAHCDAVDDCGHCADQTRAILSALQSLARERDPEFLSALLSKEQAMRREAEAALATLREAKG
jgi:hypothetical protein